ncbi:MAG TPA: porin [Paraburkholderia sp.]|jgi:predicted porin|nr:porin [Paraburkholderia sp.]
MKRIVSHAWRALPGTLLAATLSGGAGVAHAQSSVQMYGIVDAFVGSVQAPGATRAWQQGSGGLSTSFWGFGGTEDLGGGYKTLFAIEGFFRVQNGKYGSFDGDPMFSRNAYVGLQSRYGTVTLGRQSSLLYLAACQFNPFYASFTFSPTIVQMYAGLSTYPSYRTDQGLVGGTAWSNAVQYASPTVYGMTGKLLYSFADAAGDNGKKKWSAQLAYQHGPLALSGVVQYASFSSSAQDLAALLSGFKSQSAAQLGVTYDARLVKLYGEYLYTSNDRTLNSFHVNTAQAGLSIPVGTSRILASWAWSRDGGGLDQTRQTWTVSYDYPLSKRTDVYAAYMNDHIDKLSTGNTFGAGIRARF